MPGLDIHRFRTRLSIPAIAGLAVASLAWLALCVRLQTGSWSAWLHPIGWLGALTAESAAESLAGWTEVMAGVLAIAVTVVAIVVELAANRYSHRVTALFLREPVNQAVLGLFALTTIQCVWVSLVLGAAGGTAAPGLGGFFLTSGLVSLSLLLLLPYFAFVLGFISPLNIVSRIAKGVEEALEGARAGRGADSEAARQRQHRRVAAGIEELHDVTRSAVVHSDRSVAMSGVDALCHLCERYQEVRAGLPRAWGALDEEIRSDPDFVSIEPAALEPVEKHGLWLELKVFRRLIAVLDLCVPQMRDVAGLIAIRTRELGVRRGADSPELLALCIDAFNSYLRAAINARDPRTGLSLLNQYRLFAEELVAARPDATARIAAHLRYYGQLAFHLEQPFLLEVVAHDLAHLIEASHGRDDALTDRLLGVLLEVDLEIGPEGEETLAGASLIGVRKAQIQVGTLLLAAGDEARAERVAADLAQEPASRLDRIAGELRGEERPRYWEIVERGVNFGYLRPERRSRLDALLERTERKRRG